jgi:hypothetical protein
MKREFLPVCLVILLLLILPVQAYGPSITQVSPVSGPNNGVVTLTITGTGFSSLSVVRLNKCRLVTGGSSQPAFPGTVLSHSDSSITAMFDLNNKIAGDYDVSLNAPYDGHEAWAVATGAFTIYQGSGPAPVVTTAAPAVTTAATAATTIPQGTNSVFFETTPGGATIYLDGEAIGTSPFVYSTNRKGTFNVVAWKSGYEDYEAKVLILEGKLVHFVAPLTLRSTTTTPASTTAPPATTATTAPTATPQPSAKVTPTPSAPATNITTTTGTPAGTTIPVPTATSTTLPRYSIPIPTPWPTETPGVPKAPLDPVLPSGAAVLGIVLVVLRRR